MGKSIKYKDPDTYHDAGNVYDNTQGKTQENINSELIGMLTPIDITSDLRTVNNVVSIGGYTCCYRIGKLVVCGFCLFFQSQSLGYDAPFLTGLPPAKRNTAFSLSQEDNYAMRCRIGTDGTLYNDSNYRGSHWRSGVLVYVAND